MYVKSRTGRAPEKVRQTEKSSWKTDFGGASRTRRVQTNPTVTNLARRAVEEIWKRELEIGIE